ncbi:MAG: hypothetical protein LBH92_06065 [Bacteroidales bacterium]|nr:hypothetical protein [Bacteroidales bacterium]
MPKKLTSLDIIAILLFLSITGCERFEGDQEIPAYLQIDTISLQVSSAYPWITPTSQIVDAWIYVDDWLVGDFQLPCKIPILKRGECKLTVYPGVLMGQQSLQRRGYPFYTKHESVISLAEDSVTIMKNISTTINDISDFILNETFEDVNLSFDTISAKDRTAMIERYATRELDLDSRLYGTYVGGVKLDDNNKGFMIMTKEAYDDLPFNKDLIVEIDYCCNHTFVVGLQYKYQNRIDRHDVLVLGARKEMEWNKAYVNMAPRVTQLIGNYKATDFKIYIRADLNEGEANALFYFDNIRFIRPKA